MARLGRSQPIQAVLLAPRITAAASPKFATLVDAFNSADTAKWTFGTGSSVTGGQLILAQTGSGTVVTQTANTYDLGSSSVSLSMQPTIVASTAVQVGITPGTDLATDSAYFQVNNAGLLAFTKVIGGVAQVAGTAVTYDSTAHKYLRFADSGGAVLYQTSPDAQTWTTRATWTPGWSLSPLRLYLTTINSGSGTITVAFDNVNVFPVVPDLATSTPTAYAPTVTPGAITVVPDLVASTPATYAPTVTATLTVVPDLATSTPAVYAPDVTTPLTVTPGVAASTPQTYAPTVTGSLTVVPDAATSTPDVYAPTVTAGAVTVIPDVATSSPAIYDPVVIIVPTPSHIVGTAVLETQTLGTAVLAGNGLSTAVLAAQTLGTASVTYTPGTATIDTT